MEKWTPPIFSAFVIFMISMFQTKYEKSSEVKTFDKYRDFEIRMSLMALIFSNICCLKVQIISDTTNHPSGDHPEGVKTKILKVTNYIDLD